MSAVFNLLPGCSCRRSPLTAVCFASSRQADVNRRRPELVLGVQPGADAVTLKRAFREKLKVLHPDVNGDAGASKATQELIWAFRVLTDNGTEAADPALGPFDAPDGPPDFLFVNPFACTINALDFGVLQRVAAQGNDPVAAIRASGVSCSDNAAFYVTSSQRDELLALLDTMFDTLAFDQTSAMLGALLSQANRINGYWRDGNG